MKEYKEELRKLKEKLSSLGGFFEIDVKKEEIPLLEKQTAQPDFWNDPRHAQRIMQELNGIKNLVGSFEKLEQEYHDAETYIDLAQEEKDTSLDQEIQNHITKLTADIDALDFQSKLSGTYDPFNAIVTLHSGAGGTEACDWAEMLLRMYQRWAEKKGYKTEIFDIIPGDEAGIKRITFVIKGLYAYGYLKSEIGIHRLVRISPFDSNKRRHTSFASCDVIPELDETITVDIKDADLRIDTYRASGHGGQHVNKTDSAVRITHMPTGIVVQCQSERSQFKNKSTAMKFLKARLIELEEEKKRAEVEKHYDDQGQIAWGSQIRSYVFMPYQMVKDHRTGFEIGNVESVMNGDIDGFMQAYLNHKIIV
ncbi:MAG: peptide chain release factor 2 [bacterium]